MKQSIMLKSIFFLCLIGVLLIILFFSTNSKDEGIDKVSNESGLINYQEDKDISSSKIKVISGFSRPFAINFDSKGNIYVIDFELPSLLKYDSDFNFIENIAGNLNKPHSVDFDSEGNLYIADYGSKRILKFSKTGEFISSLISPKQLIGPATAYFDKDFNLYVADYGSSSLLKFSEKGTFLGWIGSKSDGTLTEGWTIGENSSATSIPGGFDRLHSARVSEDGDIYVIDTWNHRVQKFSNEGKFLGWIGAKSNGDLTNGWETTGFSAASSLPGGFNAPISLDFSENGDLIIFEFKNPRVQRFSQDGKFLGWIGTKQDKNFTWGWELNGTAFTGSDLGMFYEGYDARIHNNKLYVVDTGNDRIQVITI